jgi:hypothetical protein
VIKINKENITALLIFLSPELRSRSPYPIEVNLGYFIALYVFLQLPSVTACFLMTLALKSHISFKV